MKVQNIKTSQIRYPQSAEIKTSNSVTIPAQLTDEKNSGSKILYYKDCFFNKNISFSGKQNQDSPINKAELKNKLIKYDSYNDSEINTILAMIDTILEYDRWEETDESILCEMFRLGQSLLCGGMECVLSRRQLRIWPLPLSEGGECVLSVA